MKAKKMHWLVIALLAVSLVVVSVSASDAGHYRRGHWGGYYSYYRPYWGGVFISPFYGYPVGYYPYYRPYYAYPYPYRPYVSVGAPFFYPFLPGISFYFGF